MSPTLAEGAVRQNYGKKIKIVVGLEGTQGNLKSKARKIKEGRNQIMRVT